MKMSALKVGALLGLAALAGCGSDTTAPDPLVGNYIASQFMTTGTSGQTNQLLIGSTLNITLKSDGTTSGHLHFAASGSQPAFDADMAGTWSREGNTVEFDQTADSFVRDMPFTVTASADATHWELVGDRTFSGTRIQLTLTPGGQI